MSKLNKILVLFLVAILILLTYLESGEQEELNWNPSYTATDKIPLGSYALFQALQDQEFPVEKIKQPPYEYLKSTVQPSGTYFFINDKLSFEQSELKELMQWLDQGNTVFLVADTFSKNLLDTLGIDQKLSVPGNSLSSKPMFNLSDPMLKAAQPYLLDRDFPSYRFSGIDSIQHRVLGITQLFKDSLEITSPQVNFVMDSVGKGIVFLHSSPKAFSNYFLLKEQNYQYAERVMAYLPKDQPVLWDAYYKTGKAYQSSPLYILFQHRNLKWAYYFVLAGGLMFILFEGKRKQRSIPVIRPLQNQSINFARTLSGLYYRKKDYTGITSKKIRLFLDYIRRTYNVPTDAMHNRFYERLGGLSGNKPEEVKALWELMRSLQEKDSIEKNDLLALHEKIKAFKTRKNGK